MPPKGHIFLSYRRADSRYATLIIYDRLVEHFGDGAVFMDVETIDAGVNFVKVLEDAVKSCDVLLAVIGENWLNIKDKDGNRRLDNEKDFVRVEISAALKRNIRVIPVLLDDAPILKSTKLPDDLKPLAERNAFFVKASAIHADITRLIPHVVRALREAEAPRIQQQNQIAKLLTQVDTAIAAQDWALAQQKLIDILVLDEQNLLAQAELEFVEAKFVEKREEKERKEREVQTKVYELEESRKQVQIEKEPPWLIGNTKSRADARTRKRTIELKDFLHWKGIVIGAVFLFLLACLIFGGNYLIKNLFEYPTPTATKYFPTETPTPTLVSSPLPIRYYIDCYCEGTEISTQLNLEPLGGVPPYIIYDHQEDILATFVEAYNLKVYLGDIYALRLESSDIPPLIWEGTIEFECSKAPDCMPDTLPLDVTWNIVEKCSSNELEIALIISGGKEPYEVYPAFQYRFSINEPQKIRVISADGQSWEAILDPTDRYCGK